MRSIVLTVVVATCAIDRSPAGPRSPYPALLGACAWVVTPGQNRGTGWLVDRPGRLLITNYHIVGDHEQVDIFFPVHNREGQLIPERSYYIDHRRELRASGRAVTARVIHRDRSRDLALLEAAALPEDAVPLRLAGTAARAGDAVHSMGNRRDVDALWNYTSGTVRQVYRSTEGYFWQSQKLAVGATILITQAAINEGDSGGPLINDAGEVIGVAAAVQWKVPAAGLAVDVREVRAFLAEAGRKTGPPADDRAPPANDPPVKGNERYRQALAATAWVRTDASNRSTGFLVDRTRRLLIASLPAVARQDRVEVVFPCYHDGAAIVEADYYLTHRDELRDQGRIVSGCVLIRDPVRQLALVELAAIPDDAAELDLAAASVEPGDRVHGLGNPAGIEALWLYSSGTVRQVLRTVLDPRQSDSAVRVILAQLPVHNGDRGGPLVNDAGQLVGILGSKDSPQQLVSYCLDVAEVRAFLRAADPVIAPRTPADLNHRAQLFLRAGWYGAAIEAFNAAGVNGPSSDLLARRAQAWRLHGHPARALADCRLALEAAPRSTAALCERAAAWNALGQPGRALADCAAALRLDPRCAAAYCHRAAANRLQGRLTQARADCDEALWLDPGLAIAHAERGWVHQQQGDLERALADFSRAIELEPYAPATYRRRAEIYRLKGRLDWALHDATRAIENDPLDALAWWQRAAIHFAKGAPVAACADRQRAVRAVLPQGWAVFLSALEGEYTMME